MLLRLRHRQAPGGVFDLATLLGTLACVALLLGIGLASVWQADANDRALVAAQAGRQQRNLLASILLASDDAETSQRGFLLTNKPDYLRPLALAERSLPGLLATLETDRAGDPQMAKLGQVMTAKLAELAQTVRLAQGGDLASALRIVRTDSGNIDSGIIRTIVAGFEADLDGRLDGLDARIGRGGRVLIAIDASGLLMILALAGLIALGLRRTVRTLRDAQQQTASAYDALERSNERLDETVRERTAELTAANEEIQRFAYIVSHDLRAPLVNIMGFTSELEQAAGVLTRFVTDGDAPAELREAAAEDIPEALRFIKSSTSKMDRLINAILRLSREGRRVLTPERLNMGVLLQSIADSLQHQAASNAASVTIGPVPDLLSDRLAVEQVFSNLLENALKYLKPGRPGAVTVTGRNEAGSAHFDVVDNGRGIAERDYERVFELFRRAGDQSVPGEGIGLAHVRALVRRLGGRIDCRSTLDAGTTFSVVLPLKPCR